MSFTPKEAISILSQKFLLQEGIAGVSHGSNVLKVYVESPEVAEKIPKSLMDFPVKVIVSGRFKALSLLQETLPEAKSGRTIAGLEASRTARWAKIPGGVSIGSVLITAGTLATRVFDNVTGEKLMLSNRHVFYGPIGTNIVQPGKYDGGKDVVGYVYRYVDLKPPPDTNLVDCALGRPLREEDLSDEVLDIGVITDWEEPTVEMKVCKSGRTSGYTESTITDVNASIKVYYGRETFYVFEDQIITGHTMDPGDSGSLLVSTATKRAVGLGFAGSDTLSCANKISNVLSMLNIRLSPSGAVVPPSPVTVPFQLAFIPVFFGAFISTYSMRY